MSEIRLYAAARGILPSTVLQNAANLGGTTWSKWEAGTASCTMKVAEKVRAYMAANPPEEKTEAAE
ncbi:MULTISPECIES: XRE family transcriptional regulator [Haematobacter]|mgnify:CR=1 FL=1|nr:MULTISPECIES: XRE family transcriptional regulator [Haematobacter]